MAKNIKPRATDYSQWYLDVIKAAKLADYTPVKGCMAIRSNSSVITNQSATRRVIAESAAPRANQSRTIATMGKAWERARTPPP